VPKHDKTDPKRSETDPGGPFWETWPPKNGPRKSMPGGRKQAPGGLEMAVSGLRENALWGPVLVVFGALLSPYIHFPGGPADH